MSATTWLYLSSGPNLWTVGFYNSLGEWVSESDHDSPKKAAERVHYLNGGAQSSISGLRDRLETLIARMNTDMEEYPAEAPTIRIYRDRLHNLLP